MLNEKIRKRRIELGLTMPELAERAGITRQTLSKWEKGDTTTMRVDNFFNLCSALLLTPNDLYEIDSDRSGLETKIVNLVSSLSFDDKVSVYEYITKTLKNGS